MIFSPPGVELTDDIDVVVCTIERANVLLTQLLERGRAHEVCEYVVMLLPDISTSLSVYLNSISPSAYLPFRLHFVITTWGRVKYFNRILCARRL